MHLPRFPDGLMLRVSIGYLSVIVVVYMAYTFAINHVCELG